MWNVWKVHYLTYAEIAEFGELPRTCVARRLSFAKAMALVEELGFGHSMHPSA